MESAFEDEITAINSIYGDNTLVLASQNPRICTLRLPQLPSLVLRVEFPNNYPDESLVIIGTETVGSIVPKGQGADVVLLAQRSLQTVWQAGEPCVFDLIERLEAELMANEDDNDLEDQPLQDNQRTEPSPKANDVPSKLSFTTPDVAPPWTITAALTERKSVFVGRAVPVSSPEQAKEYLQHLLITDKKIAKATHNITAWRIRGQNETSYQDCDDDGETAAGGRILHLMQLMDVWDVTVVVTRWYGGVLLGPDRFRIINQVAREALVSGNFVKETDTNKKKGKK